MEMNFKYLIKHQLGWRSVLEIDDWKNLSFKKKTVNWEAIIAIGVSSSLWINLEILERSDVLSDEHYNALNIVWEGTYSNGNTLSCQTVLYSLGWHFPSQWLGHNLIK